MENALWKDKKIIAMEISKEYMLEKQVRKASRDGELLCVDPQCSQKELKYCHGKIKRPYFAHKENPKCDYADYMNRKSELVQDAINVLYWGLRGQGIKVRKEIKLLKHHYSDLVIEDDRGKLYAVEVITKSFLPYEQEKLEDNYSCEQIGVIWVEVGDATKLIVENKTCFADRFLLNEQETLLLIDQNFVQAIEYKMIPNQSRKNIYKKNGLISEIKFIDGRLTFPDFDKQYSVVCGLENQIEEEKQENKIIIEQSQKEENFLIKNYQEQCDYELEQRCVQNEYDAYNNQKKRIYKCRYCGKILTVDSFILFAGKQYSRNEGKCYACHRKSIKDDKYKKNMDSLDKCNNK